MKNNYFYIKNFLYILFIYFFLHLLIRVMISPNVGLDEAEQLLLTQNISWGYNAQPPLYTWIQYVYFELFGTDIFALSLFKNTLLFLTYVFIYKSTKIVTNNSTLAMISAASLILIPQISWESQRALTHSVLLTSISSIVIYVILKIKYSEDNVPIYYYFLLGILISLGMLAKYNFSFFIFAVFITSLLDQKLRSVLLKKELFITISITVLLLLPHLLWLLDHMTVVTSSTLKKLNSNNGTYASFIGIASIVKAIFAFLGPLLIVSIFLLRKSLTQKGNRFLFHFFIIVSIILLFFMLVTDSTYFKDRWLQPYFFLMSIYIASKINIETLKKQNLVLYFKIIYFFMFMIIVLLIARVCLPDVTKGYSRLNYPFYALSQQIKESDFNHGFIIAENKIIGGNMKLNFPDSVVSAENFEKPVDSSQTILIVWENKFPAQAKKYKHLIKTQKKLTSPYRHSKRKNYELNIAIVPNEK